MAVKAVKPTEQFQGFKEMHADLDRALENVVLKTGTALQEAKVTTPAELVDQLFSGPAGKELNAHLKGVQSLTRGVANFVQGLPDGDMSQYSKNELTKPLEHLDNVTAVFGQYNRKREITLKASPDTYEHPSGYINPKESIFGSQSGLVNTGSSNDSMMDVVRSIGTQDEQNRVESVGEIWGGIKDGLNNQIRVLGEALTKLEDRVKDPKPPEKPLVKPVEQQNKPEKKPFNFV